MTWDREHYRLTVLDRARQAGNVPPADLYERYGLSKDMSDPAAFAAQVADVLAYWRQLAVGRIYSRLAEALITAHRNLEQTGPLTLATFAGHNERARRELLARLARLADAEAGAATHVGPSTVMRLCDALSCSVTEAEATEALSTAGVRVVEVFPELPAVPHPRLADLVQEVRKLGRRLSAEVVFGDAVRRGFRVLDGFRLADGRQLDEAALGDARDRAAVQPFADPATGTTRNVLAALSNAARTPGDLDALLLSEVVEWLRRFAGQGFVQRAIAGQARELGLAEDEAGLVAAALLAAGTVDAVRQQVEERLAAAMLRTAQRLAAGLPAEDPLRERIAGAEAEVSELGHRADQELAGGRRELAATLLAEALRIASDDGDLAERLAALAPPAPRNGAARLDGDRVLVTWEPSPARAGRLRYRVRRGRDRAPLSPADGAAVAIQAGRYDVTDAEAPLGDQIIYSIFADRGGETCSPPAVTPSLVFAPDVTNISVAAAETSVAVSWQAHPGSEGIRVERGDGHPPRPGTGAAVGASLGGFTDVGLCTGTEYFYRIAAWYRAPDGQRRESGGVVVSAMPAPEPDPVTDLQVTALEGADPVVSAVWTPPRHGRVSLIVSDEPAAWARGARIRPEEVATLSAAPGVTRREADGRDRLIVELTFGQHYLLPLTSAGSVTVVGDPAEVSLAQPVHDLSALRLHDDVRLGWVWPRDATDAVVHWPGGKHQCSRRVYEDEGGVTVTVGRAETEIDVRAIYQRPGGVLPSRPARIRVPGRGVAVSYRIRSASRMRPRRRTIEFVPECATRLPAVVVVRSTGPYLPGDPAEGETVARVPPQLIAPDRPATITVELSRGPAWLACFVDPDGPGDPDNHDGPSSPDPPDTGPPVLLFHPPDEEMRIR